MSDQERTQPGMKCGPAQRCSDAGQGGSCAVQAERGFEHTPNFRYAVMRSPWMTQALTFRLASPGIVLHQ